MTYTSRYFHTSFDNGVLDVQYYGDEYDRDDIERLIGNEKFNLPMEYNLIHIHRILDMLDSIVDNAIYKRILIPKMHGKRVMK